MDWAKLVIGVLLLITSHSHSQNNDIDLTCSVEDTQINLFLRSNDSVLQLCLDDKFDNSSLGQKEPKCYRINKEDDNSKYYWTLQDDTEPKTNPSCITMLTQTSVELINKIIGILGGIMALLLVMLIAVTIACLHAHSFRFKNLPDSEINVDKTSSVCNIDTMDEETIPDKETPTPPKRPTRTFNCPSIKDNTMPDDYDYVKANDIAPWTIAEMKQKSSVIGTIIVDK